MTNSKMTKRALLTSVMALVLCFAMLTGTTFAWFTDQETSGNNQIIAGNLDIAMYNSIADYTDTTRITTNSQFKLFDDVALWEPGAVAYENISVVNEGNLALKYQISLNFEDKGLASALQVAVVEGGIDAATYPETSAGRTALIAAIDANTTNTWAPLASFSKTGNLYVDDGVGEKEVTATTYGIAVYWKPADNDNDYNVTGTGTQPSVDFGIKLIATQLAAELDAFGPEYDEPANWGDPWDGTASGNLDNNTNVTDKTLTISSAADLAAFAAAVNGGNTYSGYTVTLTTDIDLQNKAWTPIGPNADAVNKFNGTFDGNGYTIYNLYVKQDAAYKAAGLFGSLNGTVKNLTVKNATIEALSSGAATDNGIAVIAGSSYNKGNIDNVHVENATVIGNRYVGGISGYMYGNVTNCSVKNVTLIATPDNLTGSYDNGDKVGGIAGYFKCEDTEDTYEVTGNTVENVTIKGYRDIGGIVGAGDADAVQNNTVKTAVITADQSVNNYGKKDANAGEIVGRVLTGAVNSSNTATGVTINTIVLEKVSDGLFTDTNGNYYVSNAAGLQSLYTTLSTNNAGRYTLGFNRSFNIMDDIDATGIVWNSIWLEGSSGTENGMVFNGNGHTISNLGIGGSLFGGMAAGVGRTPAVFKDITFNNVNVTLNYYHVATIWSSLYGDIKFENVNITNSKITGGCNVAAFVGSTTYEGTNYPDIVFENCNVSDTVIESTYAANSGDPFGASAYVGRAYGSTTITFNGTNAATNIKYTNYDNNMAGNGIYAYGIYDGGWKIGGSVSDFTNFSGYNG